MPLESVLLPSIMEKMAVLEAITSLVAAPAPEVHLPVARPAVEQVEMESTAVEEVGQLIITAIGELGEMVVMELNGGRMGLEVAEAAVPILEVAEAQQAAADYTVAVAGVRATTGRVPMALRALSSLHIDEF